MSEKWRQIPWATMYEVSDHGRVRSYFESNSLPVPHAVGGYVRNGYSRVRVIKNDGTKKWCVIHRLVAEAFLQSPPSEQTVVRHLDGDKTRNRASNLAWGTQAENVSDTLRHGRHREAAKTHCTHGHEFTPENTYVAPGAPAHRHCRTCKNDRQRANRAHGRNLLDLVVDGVTVRDRVAARLAEVTPAEQTAGEESARGVEG